MFKKFFICCIFFSFYLFAQTPNYKNVTRLYIATFNRTPDMAGLDYWVYQSNLSLEKIAESFFDQPETKRKYPDTKDTDYFIKSVYQNLFDREPDRDGLLYWQKQLDNGYVKNGQFILALINGALGDDRVKLANSTYKALEELKLAIYMDAYFSKTSGRYYDSGVDNNIIDDINSAKKSIYMAVYEMTNKHIVSALKNAYDRGVDIKIYTDDSTIDNDAFTQLQSYGIDVNSDSDAYALMHNKFTLIDGSIVWSGSGNYTVYSFYRNNENYIRIKDSDIAKTYTNKFFTLFDNKDSNIKPYQKDYTSVYFAPDFDLEDILIDKINHASKSIDFMIYAFTDTDIADALIEAKNRGVQIRGVFDEKENKYQSKYSQYDYLKDNGIDVKLDGNSFKLHDKVMIIDENTTITGSYNYTEKASNYNDENLIVIDRDDISLKYYDEFEKIYQKALEK